ncbi:hypothetical protein KC887_03995 [Candidatus Kaiserbacteria bacterium]|nr:hypothetical protein [Candidatus Kaiserbacteria bacterium]
MSIDHPHGGGFESMSLRTIASKLSRWDPDSHYIIVRPVGGGVQFVTNDQRLTVGNQVVDIYQKGESTAVGMRA